MVKLHKMQGGKYYLFLIIKALVLISLFYSLTGINKGGDLKFIVPVLLFAFTFIHIIIDKNFSIIKNPVFYVMSAYLIISYLLLPFSFAPAISLRALNKEILLSFFMFTGIYFVLKKEDKIPELINIAALFLLVLAIAGFSSLLFSGGDVRSRDILELKILKFRLHHNEFGMLINLMLSFVIAGILISNNLSKKIMFFALVVFSIVIALMNISRGGWIGLTIIIMLWSFFVIKKSKKYGMVLFVLSVLAFSVMTLWFSSSVFRERVLSTAEHARTVTGRTKIWSIYIEGIKKSPIVGWGYGNRIAWYKEPLIVDEKQGFVLKQIGGLHAHNMVLDIFFDQGIIGLSFFLVLMGVIFYYIIVGLKSRDEYRRILSFALLCSFVSVFVVHGLIETIPFKLIAVLSAITAGLNIREAKTSA